LEGVLEAALLALALPLAELLQRQHGRILGNRAQTAAALEKDKASLDFPASVQEAGAQIVVPSLVAPPLTDHSSASRRLQDWPWAQPQQHQQALDSQQAVMLLELETQ